MKIAVVHEWLDRYSGSERVLEQILCCFPHADLFCVVDHLPANARGFLKGKKTQTSFIQRLPFSKTKFRSYLLLMPLAIEQFDLSQYDLVVSSSHAVAKGVITGPNQIHLCMCYSPIRYAWDLQHQYLREAGLEKGFFGILARWTLHKLRLWDVRSANGVDQFIAISKFISKRIEKCYRRSSVVIYPPVDVSAFTMRSQKDDFYLAASRMVPYKKMPLIVEAFKELPNKSLIVIGDGPDLKRCRDLAGGNVEVMGWQETQVLRDHMQRAKAFLFAAEEDFGITPLEAQACGTPVIAFGRGGALETIRPIDKDKPTGVFFHSQAVSDIVLAVQNFEEKQSLIKPEYCRENALRFTKEIFRKKLKDLVDQTLNS